MHSSSADDNGENEGADAEENAEALRIGDGTVHAVAALGHPRDATVHRPNPQFVRSAHRPELGHRRCGPGRTSGEHRPPQHHSGRRQATDLFVRLGRYIHHVHQLRYVAALSSSFREVIDAYLLSYLRILAFAARLDLIREARKHGRGRDEELLAARLVRPVELLLQFGRDSAPVDAAE